MTVLRILSGRLQVVCAALLLLSAVRIAQAASAPDTPATAAPVTSVRAPLR